ncbi:MAG: hypothetical protein AAGF90_03495 [Pseudomonadota bacterium]
MEYSDDEIESSAGAIKFGDFYEEFCTDFSIFKKADYEKIWRDSVRRAIDLREASYLPTNIYCDELDGMIQYFRLTPSEMAAGSRHYDKDSSGVYLTEHISMIVLDPHRLEQISEEYAAKPPPFPVYYFNTEKPYFFNMYLDQSIAGISSWFVENHQFEDFAK